MGFYSNIIENHDEPRGVSYYLPEDGLCLEGKKMLAVLYFFMRGLPFIYQGQEIGMEIWAFFLWNRLTISALLTSIRCVWMQASPQRKL